MPVINILSPHVADLIAAGEVVERPASVIKELVENAFDAGAKNVTVEIRGGGSTYMRVTDDGCGMSPEDAGLAFYRHATSKLADEAGLEAIGTMGFRGEALAAISSVSNIRLTTRRRDDAAGTFVTLAAGDIQDMGEIGCPVGTTMTVKDLFFNTPARLKFMKSDRSEASACIQTAMRCALGRPEVSVRFIRDGKEEFFSPGDGKADSCIYTLLGRDMANSLLSCESTDEGVSLSGFISSPSAGRGNRSAQYFFCNGRYIKSPLLQAAVEQAYKNTLLTGRYPACVLYLDIACSSVDVNVHPAKTEVRFTYEKKIFDLVYHAARFALEGESRSAEIKLSSTTEKLLKPQATPYDRLVSAPEPPSARFSASEVFHPARSGSYSAPPPRPAMPKSYEQPQQSYIDLPSRPISTVNEPKTHDSSSVSAPAAEKIVENTVQNVETSPYTDHKIVGEALKTYIIVERGEELILIDKHAAHERIIFDRLKSQPQQIMAQGLLVPVTVKLSTGDAELIEKNALLFDQLGFEIELFGESDYIIRAVPADMDAGDVAAAVEEICEKLRRSLTVDASSARDEILHTVACKAAIKAGWNTHRDELIKLADAVMSGAVKYCPHGRPVSITLTRKELDKQFMRIV